MTEFAKATEYAESTGILFQHDGAPVPLVGVEVQGDIAGSGAKVKISQSFINTEKKPIEAVYKFPLPENAAICGFRALIDGRIIEGVIEEKEKAFEKYDKALEDGHKAQLLDEERPNIFTLSVGNIQPGGTVIIEINYVTLLESYNSEVRFCLPTTISPRFTPASQKDDNGIPVSDIVNPPFAMSVPYGLSINIHIHGRKSITSIESPSHTINTKFEGDDAVVSFSSGKAAMDRDFILTVAYEKKFASKAFLSKNNDETFIQIHLMTDEMDELGKTGNAPQKKEIIFVLDCSGSMQGESITEAKKALEILIRALGANTTFNIYRFGGNFDHLYRQSKSYNEKSMKEALKYLSKTDADMGGTEVLTVLEDIYKTRPADGFQKQIFLLTDGQISNEDDVMLLVGCHNLTTTLSTVGIGSGPNEFLIGGVARAAGGSSEMIAPQERIESKVLRLFQRVMAGRIDNLKIDFGVAAEQTPTDPIVYRNQGASIFARIKSGELKNKSVKVQQYNNEGETLREWNLEIEEVNDQEMPLSKLWAREKIREIEEEGGAGDGSRQHARIDKRKRDRAMEMSRQYGVISRSTSFIGIEKTADAKAKDSDMVLRVVPTSITSGWHGLRSQIQFSINDAPRYMRRDTVQYSIRQMPDAHVREPEDIIPSFLRDQRKGNAFSKTFDAASQVVRNTLSRFRKKDDELFDILSLQKSGGGFDTGRVIDDLLNIDSSGWRAIADSTNVKDNSDLMSMLMTAVVLALLEEKFGARKSEWDGIISKSRLWLKEQVARVKPTVDREPLYDWAKNFVREKLIS